MENEQDIFIRNKYDSDESSNELELVVEKDEAPKEQEKVEGNINGQNIFEFDISALDDKPWNKPGADITDYFNYGFNETTWREYCNMQKNKNLNPQKIKNDASRKYDNYKGRRDNVDEGDNKYRYTKEENRNRRYDYSNKY